jgi:beta-glucosidase
MRKVDIKYKIMKRIAAVALLMSFTASYAQVYKDKNAPVEARVNDLAAKMTLEEKIDYIGGYKGFYIRGIERLGLPEIKLTDGPVGTHKDGKSTAYPASVLSAATWDTALVYELGRQLGRDSRARGVHVLLAPGVNILRAPMGGRNFEYFTEDPTLNARMAVAYVKGLQDEKVVATVKHYAANNQEWDRHNVSSDIDERTLHEIYLLAFKAAVQEAKAGSIMNSYNLINGVHASQHDELNNKILRDRWGFDGFVMSDWSSTYDAVGAANGGLDLEMPRARFMTKEKLIPAIQQGLVKESTIDDKVKRMLRIIFRFGFFDNIQLDKNIPLDNPDAAKVALELARGGIVLLKNKGHVLPLDASKIKNLAVIGPNANAYISGGGSSYTFPFHSVSTLQGIRQFAKNVNTIYAPGLPTLPDLVAQSVFYTEPGSTVRGLKAEYFNNIKLSGAPAKSTIDTTVSINNGWHIAAENQGIPFDHCSIRWTGVVKPVKTSGYRFTVRGFDGFRLYVDTTLVINEWKDQGITTREAVVQLEAGKEYKIRLEYFANVHPVDISFAWREDRILFDEAINAASTSDAAIVCIGFNESSERESNDRSFALPQFQDSLIQCIAKVNPNTIVLLNAGGNVNMQKWISKIPALVHIWYAGQEGGTAIAEILFGKTNPSGKLPVSFEKRWEDNPAFNYYYDPTNSKRVAYKEGIFIGYRHYDRSAVKPLFPFGFGLSYTSFKYSGLTVANVARSSAPSVKLQFTISNSGKVDGAEVAQVYVRQLNPKVPRPYKELKAFSKTVLKKGEKKTISITLDATAFEYYSTEKHAFVHDAGAYEIIVASSAEDIKLRKKIHIQ